MKSQLQGLIVSLYRKTSANSARFLEASAAAAGFTFPRVDLIPKRTQAAKCVAQSLLFVGDGFSESLLNPVENRSMSVGNKGRKFSRIGFQHGKLVEFLPILRAGRAVG
jgi:hypothetical protein